VPLSNTATKASLQSVVAIVERSVGFFVGNMPFVLIDRARDVLRLGDCYECFTLPRNEGAPRFLNRHACVRDLSGVRDPEKS
jgi:hypothetical protein